MRIWNSLRLRADNNSGHAGIYATENHSSRHHLQSTSDATKARNFNFLIHEQEQHYLFSWNAGFGSEGLSLWKSDVRIESNQPPWEKTRPSDKRYSFRLGRKIGTCERRSLKFLPLPPQLLQYRLVYR
jgi:hypothetical protein